MNSIKSPPPIPFLGRSDFCLNISFWSRCASMTKALFSWLLYAPVLGLKKRPKQQSAKKMILAFNMCSPLQRCCYRLEGFRFSARPLQSALETQRTTKGSKGKKGRSNKEVNGTLWNMKSSILCWYVLRKKLPRTAK